MGWVCGGEGTEGGLTLKYVWITPNKSGFNRGGMSSVANLDKKYLNFIEKQWAWLILA